MAVAAAGAAVAVTIPINEHKSLAAALCLRSNTKRFYVGLIRFFIGRTFGFLRRTYSLALSVLKREQQHSSNSASHEPKSCVYRDSNAQGNGAGWDDKKKERPSVHEME